MYCMSLLMLMLIPSTLGVCLSGFEEGTALCLPYSHSQGESRQGGAWLRAHRRSLLEGGYECDQATVFYSLFQQPGRKNKRIFGFGRDSASAAVMSSHHFPRTTERQSQLFDGFKGE
jgi:hypothetical protein